MERALGRMKSEKSSTQTQDTHSESELDAEQELGNKANIRGSEFILSNTEWVPLYSIWCWQDPNSREKCITVAVVLPSGVGDQNGQVNVYVDNEAYLAIRVDLPSALTNTTQLHKLWLSGATVPQIQNYHPRIQGHLQALDSMSAETKKSTTKIELPCIVSPQIREKKFLSWKDTTQRVLYCTMVAPQSSPQQEDEIIEFTCL